MIIATSWRYFLRTPLRPASTANALLAKAITKSHSNPSALSALQHLSSKSNSTFTSSPTPQSSSRLSRLSVDVELPVSGEPGTSNQNQEHQQQQQHEVVNESTTTPSFSSPHPTVGGSASMFSDQKADPDLFSSNTPSSSSQLSHNTTVSESADQVQNNVNDHNNTTRIKVFVSNIPYHAEVSDIKDFLSDVEGVKFVTIGKRMDSRPAGWALITTSSLDSANECISFLNSHDFAGRTLYAQLSKPKSERPPPSSSSSSSSLSFLPPSSETSSYSAFSSNYAELIVSNLPLETTREDINHFVKQTLPDQTQLIQVRLPSPQTFHTSRYAFLRFKDQQDANTAFDCLSNQYFQGVSNHQQQHSISTTTTKTTNNLFNHDHNSSSDDNDQQVRNRISVRHVLHPSSLSSLQNTSVFITGLPFISTTLSSSSSSSSLDTLDQENTYTHPDQLKQDIQQLFQRTFNSHPKLINLHKFEDGSLRGTGHVHFSTSEETAKVLELYQNSVSKQRDMVLGDSVVRVFEARHRNKSGYRRTPTGPPRDYPGFGNASSQSQQWDRF